MSKKEEGVVTERTITFISIDPTKKTKIVAHQLAEMPPDEGEGASEEIPTDIGISTKHRPNQTFVDAMKKMRRFVFDHTELKLTTVEMNKFAVVEISISGNVYDNTALIGVKVAKVPKKFTDPCYFTMPPAAILDAEVYHDAEKVREAISEILAEAWKFIDGNFQSKAQLSLGILKRLSA